MRLLGQFKIFCYFFMKRFSTHKKARKNTKKHKKAPKSTEKHKKAQKRNQTKAQNANKRRKIKKCA